MSCIQCDQRQLSVFPNVYCTPGRPAGRANALLRTLPQALLYTLLSPCGLQLCPPACTCTGNGLSQLLHTCECQWQGPGHISSVPWPIPWYLQTKHSDAILVRLLIVAVQRQCVLHVWHAVPCGNWRLFHLGQKLVNCTNWGLGASPTQCASLSVVSC